MALVEQFRDLESSLPDDWDAAHLRLIVPDEGNCAQAAALLGPMNPGRRGKVIHFLTRRRGGGVGPDRARDLLRRLDGEGIEGTLELLDVEEAAPTASPAPRTLASAWDEAAAALPPDWSDLYAEIELTSTDYIEPAALRLSPLNPRRPDNRPLFRFRAARRFGYGASPEMVRRCFERLDEAGIRGDVRILRALSDTHPVKTQGPVWYVAGEVV